MTKTHIILSLLVMFLLSVVLYMVAQQIRPEPVLVQPAEPALDGEESIVVDCAQCDYLPEGDQRSSCFAKYNCE